MNLHTLILKAKGARSWREFAASLGEDLAYLHKVAHGKREPNDAILDKLGIYRSVTYHKKKCVD